ncbi:MAG TPA: hypothetical protein VMO00_12075 [Methylomirabilota bacterium]|jgi:hypothetical protein|nr:hypothetical protein [Methylomirabilota bacterium]
MISTLHHVNSLLQRAALNLSGIGLLAVTLCVVFPFFLVVVSIGMAGVGAHALRGRWDKRRGRRHGTRGWERFSSLGTNKKDEAR